MIEGLTQKDIKIFLDIIIKANDAQLKQLENSINAEFLKRYAVRDLKKEV